jgi:hypothetical protein
MKKVALPLLIVAGLTTSALAADMATKAPPAPPPSPWDVAITAALMNDYNFRGITQSRHNPSTQAGFELRYTVNPQWQYYGGISGESIDFPNHAAAEIDFYGGVRPTFDKLALDFGVWYYWYPGGECFNGDFTTPCNPPGANPVAPLTGTFLPNGNVVKGNLSFVEIYGKATYTFNDQWAAGIQEWYSPSVLNSGAPGWFTTGNITYTVPSAMLAGGIGMLISGDLGYWALGTSDNFYCTVNAANVCGLSFPGGVPYQSYWTWDAGVSFTYKAFTLDLRYYDTNLTKAECNVFTSDHTSTFSPGSVTALNPTGLASNWCSAAFVAKLSFATNLSNIK